MDVQLYVYDLSKGMARQMSRAFLGIQIDAVYHTSLVFGGIEYFFGAGVQTTYPGTTHHGQPMEKINLGQTQLPLDVILEYLETLKETYTAESYDLFAHNCNNFTHDFAMFLVGKGIPPHITSLPETVLQTPFGQMLRPRLDRAMRTVTQAPVASPSAVNTQANVVRSALSNAATNGTGSSTSPTATTQSKPQTKPSPPTKHRHSSLSLPLFTTLPTKPHTYTSIPPLPKLVAKIGPPFSTSPATTSASTFLTAQQYSTSTSAPVPLPDLPAISTLLRSAPTALPLPTLFAALDLFRLLLIDSRISGFFAEEASLRTVATLLLHARDVQADEAAMKLEGAEKLVLVAMKVACNLFTSPLMVASLFASGNERVLEGVVALAARGVASGAGEGMAGIKATAAALAVNIATASNRYLPNPPHAHSTTATHLPPSTLSTDHAIELAASLIESIGSETNPDVIKNMAIALGRLVYGKSEEEVGELGDVCLAMEAGTAVEGKAGKEGMGREEEDLVREIGSVLLEEGLVVGW